MVATHARQPASNGRGGTSLAAATRDSRRTTGPPFEQDRANDEGQERRRELRCGDAVPERKPRAVDAGRERVDGEIGDRSVVGERFHQRERDTARNSRPGERQIDTPEGAARVESHRARGFDERCRALEECGARQQIDIRIEHGDEHRGSPAERAHRRGTSNRQRDQPNVSRSAVCTGPAYCSQSV
jgi:hypothetical protein